ncbi:MAG TPA: helix-turn-helix domain-containing protein [Streptosporangiaceae bacterium]|nr:helix-turn-helix domain-containing protein [Streptosporangiaceae bacterium]
MSAKPAPRRGWEAFARPAQINQRRYEAVRAYVLEGAPLAEAAARFGYSPAALASLVRDFRAGKLALFAEPGRPGRKSAPKKDAARSRVVELRRQGLSVHEISRRLAAEGRPLNRTGVGQILAEEGFGRLLRHPEPEASISPATPGRDTKLPPAKVIDFASFPATATTRLAGLLLAVPDLAALDLPALARAAGYPGTRVIPAVSWLLSLLALKLTATRRVSHVDDLLDDPASALFAGLAILPKKSALTEYSYRLSHDHQRAFLAALDAKLIAAGLAGGDQRIFDLDFHAVMHWGHDPVLEKHYVPTRSQRARSVLTFFAQDSGTHNLVYANADISKATQHREAIAFCDHWRQVSGHDPKMLVMDQKVTSQKVLGELDGRGVKFLTLRMRSAALVRHINSLTPKDYKTVALDRPGPHNKPRVHEDKAVKLTSYPGTVRQLVVTGLGRDAATIIITNEEQATIRNLISQYARRMTIEQRLAEIIRAFCADALSSTVNLNVDLDIMLCVLAQALLAAFRTRLGPGYATATPDTLQRRFLDSPGTINVTNDQVTVRIDRRAYSPVLRQASLPPDTTVPWWHGRRLHFEFG